MELKRWKNFKFYWTKKSSMQNKISDSAMDFILRNRLRGTITLFDGYEESLNNLESTRNRRASLYFLPPIGPIKNNFVTGDELFLAQYDSRRSQFTNKSRRMSNLILKILNQMADSSYWDEAVLYRFFALNEFINSRTGATFGEFCVENEDRIDEIFTKFSARDYGDSTKILYDAYSHNMALYYRTGAPKKAEELIASLTVDEVMKILKSKRKQNSTNSVTYFTYLTNLIEEIRNKSVMSGEEIHDSLIQSFMESVNAYGTDGLYLGMLFEDFIKNTKFISRDSSDSVAGMTIANKIDQVASDVSPVELLVFMSAISHMSLAFKSCDHARAMSIVSKAADRLDNQKMVDFIVFVSNVVLEYDGPLANYSEWIKAIRSDSDSFSLGPIFAMGLISSHDISSETRKIHGETERLRSRYRAVGSV